jgi:hypothetical protein
MHYAAIKRRSIALGVWAGTTPIPEFFAPENIKRILMPQIFSIETSVESPMADAIYDMIMVGGASAAQPLARAMAQHGARVLVLEREPPFKGRFLSHIPI